MSQLLDPDAIRAALPALDGWTGDTDALRRDVAAPDFPTAIRMVDRIALVAEDLDHHPDIDIRWRNLTLVCSTHSAGGVTALDLDLARRIDEVVRELGG